MSTTDRIPEYLYTQDDINFIIQENKRLKDRIKELEDSSVKTEAEKFREQQDSELLNSIDGKGV